MKNHTPGPWTFSPETGTSGNDDNDMGGIYSAASRVCWFGNGTQYYPLPGEPPSDADGLLMAAAPDLLAAAQRVTAAFRALGHCKTAADALLRIECEAAMLALEAAANKAKGGPA